MTFMAPVPWEADAFYAQPGMAEASLTLDTWPVGTGPFMQTEYFQDRRQVMERNPNYRGEPYPCEGMPGDKEAGLLDDCGKKTPFVDTIVVDRRDARRCRRRPSSCRATTTSRCSSAPTWAWNTSSTKQDSEDVRKEYDEQGLPPRPLRRRLEATYIGFNMLDPVIGKGDTPEQQAKNRKLRQAISIAIDWEEYSNDLPEQGRRDRAWARCPPASSARAQADARGRQPGDAQAGQRPAGAPLDRRRARS